MPRRTARASTSLFLIYSFLSFLFAKAFDNLSLGLPVAQLLVKVGHRSSSHASQQAVLLRGSTDVLCSRLAWASERVKSATSPLISHLEKSYIIYNSYMICSHTRYM